MMDIRHSFRHVYKSVLRLVSCEVTIKHMHWWDVSLIHFRLFILDKVYKLDGLESHVFIIRFIDALWWIYVSL